MIGITAIIALLVLQLLDHVLDYVLVELVDAGVLLVGARGIVHIAHCFGIAEGPWVYARVIWVLRILLLESHSVGIRVGMRWHHDRARPEVRTVVERLPSQRRLTDRHHTWVQVVLGRRRWHSHRHPVHSLMVLLWPGMRMTLPTTTLSMIIHRWIRMHRWISSSR